MSRSLCFGPGREGLTFASADHFNSPLSFLIEPWLWISSDVNQFSIITELIGTPPDEVIKTIVSLASLFSDSIPLRGLWLASCKL